MGESNYKLRERVKELEKKVELLREDRNEYKDAVRKIFNAVVSCKGNEYVPPMIIIQNLKDLIFRNKTY